MEVSLTSFGCGREGSRKVEVAAKGLRDGKIVGKGTGRPALHCCSRREALGGPGLLSPHGESVHAGQLRRWGTGALGRWGAAGERSTVHHLHLRTFPSQNPRQKNRHYPVLSWSAGIMRRCSNLPLKAGCCWSSHHELTLSCHPGTDQPQMAPAPASDLPYCTLSMLVTEDWPIPQ